MLGVIVLLLTHGVVESFQLVQHGTDLSNGSSDVTWLQGPGWTVTASNGINPECVLTNQVSTSNQYCWHAGNGGNAGQDQLIEFDMQTTETINGIRFQCPGHGYSQGVCPMKLHVYYKNDPGDDWVCAVDEGCSWSDAVPVAEGGGFAQDFFFTSKSARYWKWAANGNYYGWVPALWMLAFAQGTPATASGTGDPHLSNVFGERFDVYKEGVHKLLQVPRGAELSETLLLLEADARRQGGTCEDLYFKIITISGSWTNQSNALRFSAGCPPQQEGCRGSMGWRPFGTIDLKVVSGRTNSGIDYLNVFAKHLDRAGHALGGLLGEDDHVGVSTPTPECRHQVSLRKVNMSP